MKYTETDRLVLRDWESEDLPLFKKMNKDERVMRYFPSVLTEKETEIFFSRIQSEFDRNNWGLYAVELRSAGKFIGYVGLHEIGFDAYFTPGVEIGWRLDADYHNQGLATEAAMAVSKIKKPNKIILIHSEKEYSVRESDAKDRDDKNRRVRASKLAQRFSITDTCSLSD